MPPKFNKNVRKQRRFRDRFNTPDPPSFNLVPENYIRLEWSSPAQESMFKSTDIVSQLAAQTGINIKPSEFQFRMLGIDAWGRAEDILMQVYNFPPSSSTNDFVFQRTDNFSKNHFSHIHFRPQKTFKNYIFTGDGTDTIFNVRSTAPTASVLIYVHVAWKSRYQQTPKRFQVKM